MKEPTIWSEVHVPCKRFVYFKEGLRQNQFQIGLLFHKVPETTTKRLH